MANRSTTGFLPSTSAKSASCIDDGGRRVSIEAMFPAASSSVGVWMRGGSSPTVGIGSPAASRTRMPGTAVVAATSSPPRRTMPTRL